MPRNKIIKEIIDIETLLELRQAGQIEKLKILGKLSQRTQVRLSLGYMPLDILDLHELKATYEKELLNYIDISELTQLIKI